MASSDISSFPAGCPPVSDDFPPLHNIYIGLYIYIYREREREREGETSVIQRVTYWWPDYWPRPLCSITALLSSVCRRRVSRGGKTRDRNWWLVYQWVFKWMAHSKWFTDQCVDLRIILFNIRNVQSDQRCQWLEYDSIITNRKLIVDKICPMIHLSCHLMAPSSRAKPRSAAFQWSHISYDFMRLQFVCLMSIDFDCWWKQNY